MPHRPETLRVRLTTAEKAALQREADERSLGLSDLAREKLVAAPRSGRRSPRKFEEKTRDPAEKLGLKKKPPPPKPPPPTQPALTDLQVMKEALVQAGHTRFELQTMNSRAIKTEYGKLKIKEMSE